MNFGHAFFSLEGRIPRKTYWLSTLLLFAILLPIIILVAMNLFTDVSNLDVFQRQLAYFTLGMFALTGYFTWAINGKRLHDRNKSAWLFALYMIPFILDPIYTLAGVGGTIESPSMLRLGTSIFGAVIAIWLLIELGFLKGTKGPNQYGEDPLPPPTTTQA